MQNDNRKDLAMIKALFTSMGLAVLISSLGAQSLERRADLVGGADSSRGKCTVEVVVDGTAEVQIRGITGTLRDLQGQQPQWRRFQCTAPVPSNPGYFRFEGVDGRGRQELVEDPRSSGVAVVRITDADRGAEGYTFDLIWDNQSPDQPGRAFDRRRYPDDGQFRPGFDGLPGGRFTTDQAIHVCEDAIRQEARDRFGGVNIVFRDTRVDNNPGRNDWVVGVIAITRPWYRRNEVYRFSCSVDFRTGRVRTAHIGVPNY
jgi:hypothetical protein